MKLQLTKTKSIEIKLPSAGGGGSKALSDVTGVELNSGDPRGCPAVRLVRRKNAIHVAAAGFVPPPAGDLPGTWEEAAKQPVWSLPSEFQAPHAAIAVTSPDAFLRQTTLDALESDARSPAPSEGGRRRLALKTSKAGVPAPPSEGATREPVRLGVPVSNAGTRFVARAMGEESFVLETGLPEFQVLWVSRLLPEGKRPTAASIQTSPAASLAAVLSQPEFTAAGGTAFVVCVSRGAVRFAGFREGELVLFRECPGASGYEVVREAVKSRLGLGDDLVDSVMDDSLIDPRPAMEPYVRPVLQELEISLDYLARRHSIKISKVFLTGLPAGAHYWSQIAVDALKLPLSSPGAFEGLVLPVKAGRVPQLTASQSQVFLPALGAARAAMEGV